MAKINKITLDGISYDLVDTESRSLITETEQNLREELDTKQDILVSGNNIKTVNGLSLVGKGNIDLATLSGSCSADAAPIASSLNISTTEDEVILGGSTIGGEDINITIPAATTKSAGVMSAEDKTMIGNLEEGLESLNATVVNYNRFVNSLESYTQQQVIHDLLDKGRLSAGLVVQYYSSSGWRTMCYNSTSELPSSFISLDNWIDEPYNYHEQNKRVYLTEEEYNALKEVGEIDANTEYNIYEKL